ncbi:MAG: hypothetical protein Q7R35_14540 [Elusimicrobiota bacterium]|nr:hypothetical protein [Elusimicrobiota bacterium]
MGLPLWFYQPQRQAAMPLCQRRACWLKSGLLTAYWLNAGCWAAGKNNFKKDASDIKQEDL